MFIELFLLAALLIAVVWMMRGGKSAALENPVIIQSPGKYHITLAPRLSSAQSFIENIAEQFQPATSSEFATQYFEVSDSKIVAQVGQLYLLAIALRRGVLYFQAINPQPLLSDASGHLKTIQAFSDAVLVNRPLSAVSDEQSVKELESMIELTANQLKINVKPL